MATSQYTEFPTTSISRPLMWSWAGIFCGTFMFLAIESTFGLLGAAIFSSANTSASGLVTNGLATSTGFQIWMVVLSIIALYFAGKTSSKLLYDRADRNLGMYHGMVTFGMSILATILVTGLALTGGMAVHGSGVGAFLATSGEWWLFVAFILSMCSSAIGGMHGVRKTTALPIDTASTRRAA